MEERPIKEEKSSAVGVVITTVIVTAALIGVFWFVFAANNSPASSTTPPISSAQLASNDNNPGLLKDSSGNLISYNSPQDGYAALLNYLQAIIYGTSPTGLTSKSTLSDFSNVYAPIRRFLITAFEPKIFWADDFWMGKELVIC